MSIYSYNARAYMHTLASVRYLGTASDVKISVPYGYKKVFDREGRKRIYEIYENQYALPLGYTYDTVTSESDAEDLSAAHKQELTMLSAIVEDDAVEKKCKSHDGRSRFPASDRREVADHQNQTGQRRDGERW